MWTFYSAVQAALDLYRKCPVCGRGQKVKLSHKRKTVTCNNCGAPIPPAKYKL